MKQSSCYTGKSVWKKNFHLVAVSSCRSDNLCCGDIWCSQPCMTSWGFENKDSLQFRLGLFMTGFFWPARFCLFSTSRLRFGVLSVFGGVFWWYFLLLLWLLLFFFLLHGERKVGWLLVKRVWMFAVFAHALREEGNKVVWNTVLALLTWGKEMPLSFSKVFDMYVWWAHFSQPAFWNSAVWEHKGCVNYFCSTEQWLCSELMCLTWLHPGRMQDQTWCVW